MNPYGYSEGVWRRFQETPQAGVLDGIGVVRARAGQAGDQRVLELQVRWCDGRVGEARFLALGCPTTIAVGSWLAEKLGGRAPGELEGVDAAAIRAALEIPEERAHCALLGEDALRAVLKGVK